MINNDFVSLLFVTSDVSISDYCIFKVYVIGNSPASRLKINLTSFVGGGGVVEVLDYQSIVCLRQS